MSEHLSNFDPENQVQSIGSDKLNSEQPAGKEIGPKLTDTQKIIAKISFHQSLIGKFRAVADGDLETIREDAYSSGRFAGEVKPRKLRDKRIKAEYVGELLNAYAAVKSGGEKLEEYKDSRLDSRKFVERVTGLMPEINEEQSALYAEAQSWGTQEESDKIAEAFHYSKDLPKDLKEYMQGQMGLNASTLRQTLTRYGISSAATFAGNKIETILAATAGLAVNKYTSLDAVDALYLAPFVLATYGTWIAGVNQNLKSNYNSLKDTGVGQRAWSTAAFDMTRARTENETLQKIGAAVGYLAPEIQFEWAAIAGLLAGATTSQDLVWLGSANLVGTAWEFGASHGTDKFIEWKRNKFREKVLVLKQRKMQHVDKQIDNVKL